MNGKEIHHRFRLDLCLLRINDSEHLGGGPPDKQQTRRFGQDARNARVDTPGALPADYRVAALYGSANSPCLRNKTNKSSTPQGRER
ncbi:hypothetical protein RRG08_064153 [Elysia crispata]|uniref:Uncharacterized protein n=1 Tax=Elysia crispata TaxID=231223 RepID=A0AAE1DJB1_9GAST|nr:hypothetical protein RRG08_064153 [Elysia crispata]